MTQPALRSTALGVVMTAALGGISVSHAAEYANVISVTPVSVPVSTGQRVCSNETRVMPTQPSGAGAVIGAIAGGVIGNQADKRHVGGKVVTRTERQCHTENAVAESSKVTGYNVTYRNADGTTGTMRMASKPGTRVAMGNSDQVIGYDVTYRYNDQEGTLRMDQKPDTDRLPVVDGKIVTSTAVVEVPEGATRQ
jgi:uncharacterized protein YcfJ